MPVTMLSSSISLLHKFLAKKYSCWLRIPSGNLSKKIKDPQNSGSYTDNSNRTTRPIGGSLWRGTNFVHGGRWWDCRTNLATKRKSGTAHWTSFRIFLSENSPHIKVTIINFQPQITDERQFRNYSYYKTIDTNITLANSTVCPLRTKSSIDKTLMKRVLWNTIRC